MTKPVQLKDGAYQALIRWQGRLQGIQGKRVYLSEALQEAVALADTHSDADIATKSKELRGNEVE